MNDSHRTSIPAPDMEPNPGDASMEPQTPARPDTRFDITVTSYRKRKHDPDGVSIKAVLDGIIRAGILSDDSSDIIRQVTFRSEISETERTVIEISEVNS